MKRTFKIIAWLVAVVVALIAIAAVAAKLFIDSEALRRTIATTVEKQTGRELAIEGEVNISVFPWLGAELGRTTMGNAAGFGPEPFARIEQAQVRIKLLPLFRGEVESDTVVLRGMELNLARNAEGVGNWEDLVAAEPAEKPEVPTEPSKRRLEALAIGGLRVEQAKVSWVDGTTGQQVVVDNLNLITSAIVPDQPIPMSLALDLSSNEPEIQGHLVFEGNVGLNLEEEIYRLEKAELSTNLQSPLLPTGQMEATLALDAVANLKEQTAWVTNLRLQSLGAIAEGEADIEKLLETPEVKGRLLLRLKDAKKLLGAVAAALPPEFKPAALNGSTLRTGFGLDLGRQQLRLEDLQLAALGLELQGALDGSRIVDAPTFQGSLTSNEFVLRDLIEAVGITLPEMADASVLTKASLATKVRVDTNSVALEKLQLALDQSRLTGSASVARFAKPVIRYDLRLDQIDADRYLPPPSEKAEAPPPASAAVAAAELPLELLRGLDIDGTLRVGKLKVVNLTSTDLQATLKADGGRYRLHPLSAKLYQGSYQGDIGFDVRSETPRLSMDEKLTGVQAGPLLVDFLGKEYVSGTATVSAKLTAQGLEDTAVRQSLSGNAAFSFKDGTVNGINIGREIRKAYAFYKKQPAPGEEPEQTDFAELQGTLQIDNGVVRNDDLSAKSPLFRMTGAGSADLVKERIDYRVNVAVVSTLKGQGGAELQELRAVTIPIRIRGPFADPGIKVDIEAALRARAQEVLEKEKQKAEERARQQVEEQKKRLEEQLRKGLEGLFKR